jgi:UDP-glucose 4-epimerase
MVRAQDREEYFRVPLDARSLEYELYFDEGTPEESREADYTSHNTDQLDVPGVMAVLQELPEVRTRLRLAGRLDATDVLV